MYNSIRFLLKKTVLEWVYRVVHKLHLIKAATKERGKGQRAVRTKMKMKWEEGEHSKGRRRKMEGICSYLENGEPVRVALGTRVEQAVAVRTRQLLGDMRSPAFLNRAERVTSYHCFTNTLLSLFLLSSLLWCNKVGKLGKDPNCRQLRCGLAVGKNYGRVRAVTVSRGIWSLKPCAEIEERDPGSLPSSLVLRFN